MLLLVQQIRNSKERDTSHRDKHDLTDFQPISSLSYSSFHYSPQVHESQVVQERNLWRNETERKQEVLVKEAESKTRLQGGKEH